LIRLIPVPVSEFETLRALTLVDEENESLTKEVDVKDAKLEKV
jgi:hypothetical protein